MTDQPGPHRPGRRTRVLGEAPAPGGRCVVVATNGSDAARRALKTASRLAGLLSVPLVCERVVETGTAKGAADAELDRLCGEAHDEGCEPCRADVLKISEHHTDSEHGRAMTLADEATRDGAELIVLGRHRRASGGDALKDTMTQHLLKVAPCPLLIAVNEEPRDYAKAVVAVDFSDVSERVVKAAARFAPQAKITLLHAEETPPGAGGKSARERLGELASKAGGGGSFALEVRRGDPVTVVSDMVSETAPDLLVLGTRGRTGLARIILGSVASRFVKDPPCDLLVLRSH